MNFRFYIYIIVVFALTGCFKDDEKQPLKPFKGIVNSASNSIYTHQTFFSLNTASEISHNLIEDWDLGFECGKMGENIIINGGKNIFATNLGSVDFTATTEIPTDTKWSYDASSGNPDSLAIKDWVNSSTTPYTYSNNVYVIAYRDALHKYHPIKKIKLLSLTDTSYTFVADVMENSKVDTIHLQKNNEINYVKIAINDKIKVIDIEPSSDYWDILFTQYASIIPDDNGVPTPYFLRGTYINHNRISVAKYYISESEVGYYPNNSELEESLLQDYFESNEIPVPDNSHFTSNWDAIGYKWKSVAIDEEANTAVYKADTRRIYFVKENASQKIYKLRFFSFYTKGIKGYPWFQYILIE